MEPKTSPAGALQPPGRVPPVATGTATPPLPPHGPRSAGRRERPRRVGRWIVNLTPFVLLFWGLGLVVTSGADSGAVAGALVTGVSLFLLGLLMGLGRYRGKEPLFARMRLRNQEPSRAEILKAQG